MKNSVFVVGLDGATWKVLKPFLKKNKTPFLKSLLKKGSWGTLKSVYPPITVPAWASFQTGVNPGRHGVFSFLNYRQNPLNPSLFSSESIKSERIWDYLGRFGLKSLMINMPATYPVTKINGAMVSSFLTPPGAPFAYPKSVEKMLKKIGYRIDFSVDGKYGQLPHQRMSRREKASFLEELIEIVEKRKQAYKLLSETISYSFAFLLLKETDVAQHLFWGQKNLEVFYEKIDTMLSDVHALYKEQYPEGNFLVISDHGFHPISRYEFAIYKWLENYKFIKRQTNLTASGWKYARNVNTFLKRRGVNLSKIKKVDKLKSSTTKKLQLDNEKKLIVEYGLLCASEGIYFFDNVWNDEEKENLVKMLRKVKYKTKRVFKKIALSKDIYTGSFTKDGPDIVWITNEIFSLNLSTTADRLFSKRRTYIRGDHMSDQNGIFIFEGSSFKRTEGKRLSIYDLFPLICHLLEVEVPSNIDGGLPKDLLKRGTKKAVRVRQKVHDIIEEEIDKL